MLGIPRVKRPLVDRDALMSANRKEVASTCVRIFDRIQTLPKEIQVLALAAAFILTAEATQVPPQDAFTAVTNLMYDPLTATGRGLQFDAMKYHLETELLA